MDPDVRCPEKTVKLNHSLTLKRHFGLNYTVHALQYALHWFEFLNRNGPLKTITDKPWFQEIGVYLIMGFWRHMATKN